MCCVPLNHKWTMILYILNDDGLFRSLYPRSEAEFQKEFQSVGDSFLPSVLDHFNVSKKVIIF